MRFAISAVAAASGLALLGLATFGQPNTYLRQAREQWDSLMNIAPPEVMPDQDGDPRTAAMADKMAQLQQQLAQLRDELAANRADADQARLALAVAQAQRLAEEEQQQASETPRAAEAAQQPAAAPVATAPAAPQVPPNPVLEQPAVPAPGPYAAPRVATPESPAAPAQSQVAVLPPPQAPAAPPPQVPPQAQFQTQPPVAAQAPAQSQTTPPQVPAQSQAPHTGERRESATTERRQAADRHEPAAERRDIAVLERREAAAAERREAARALPPVARPHPETEDAQSVLARLRQVTPGAAPVQDLPPQADRPVRGPSPWLKRLIAARAALAAGQIEDGRRLLQEVQLQLVFRPVNAAEDSAAASRAARDVARALEALAGNDLVQSRNYIDQAVGDGTAGAGEAPRREAASPRSGYAPAYPPY